jgi:hypothetical protein
MPAMKKTPAKKPKKPAKRTRTLDASQSARGHDID